MRGAGDRVQCRLEQCVRSEYGTNYRLEYQALPEPPKTPPAQGQVLYRLSEQIEPRHLPQGMAQMTQFGLGTRDYNEYQTNFPKH